jgi:hypothetical protein
MANLNFMEKDILMSKEDYGVCYCGGGFRACVLTYGSVSEIENIIGKIKYIGGVSGSTWFIVGYTYYNDKIKFNKYLNPENCTIDNLNLFDGDTFGNALSKVDLMKEMGSGFTASSDTKINNWITDIYNSFFTPFEI